ncbi:MAG: SHOCT domain-containing protein [Dehalococcoidales bacterium]|nr:SHOCT domain-containing protein [Dehalococcoidales bacterium]
MMGYWFDGGWIWMIFGFILFVLFWGGLLWLIVWAVKRTTASKDHGISSLSALDIVKNRYAKGEITKEQFELIKKDIG